MKKAAIFIVFLGLLLPTQKAAAQCNAQAAAGVLCGVPLAGPAGIPRNALPSVFGVPTLAGTNVFTAPQSVLATAVSGPTTNRGPLFVVNNTASSGHAAGKNMGCQFWVGDNPTATPAANQSVNCTMYIDNLNRSFIHGLNIVTFFGDLGAGWADTTGMGLEVEVNNFFAANSGTDPFGSSATRKNGITVTTGLSTVGRTTSAYSNWGAQRDGTGWVDTSFAASSAYNYGYRCIANPGGETDLTSAFKTACFSDESDSVNVFKIARSHSTIFDLSANPTFSEFVLGKTTGATDLRFRNASDNVMALRIDSGAAAAQISALVLSDRQNDKWTLLKDAGNNLAIQNDVLATQPFRLNVTSDQATFSGQVAVSNTTASTSLTTGALTVAGGLGVSGALYGTTANFTGALSITNTGISSTLGNWSVGTAAGSTLGITRAVRVLAASGTAGLELGSGAGVSALFIATDGASYGNITTNGALQLILQTNNINRIVIPGNSTHISFPGTAPAVSACGTSPGIVGSDAAGRVITGTGNPTSCTITFNVAYGSEPFCVVHGKTTTQVTSYTLTASAIVVTTPALSGAHIEYICHGQ
jgi:hypothetical protein